MTITCLINSRHKFLSFILGIMNIEISYETITSSTSFNITSKTYVSSAHNFGQSIQRLAFLWVEHHGTGIFEMGSTEVTYQRLWNQLHQQLVRPVFSFTAIRYKEKSIILH